MLVPYFDGERTPNLPDATGTFTGLTTATTREQIALAAHDGVLCGLLAGLDALRAAGASVDGRVFLVGGGARSIAYRRRLADLTAQPVHVPSTDETVASGAAVQAALVAGARTIDTIAAEWQLGGGDVVEPQHDARVRRIAYAAVAAG
jgi:xylulokinase